MQQKQPLTEIARCYGARWRHSGSVIVPIDGYVIDIDYRRRAGLVVAFDHMQPASGPRPLERAGWGSEFLGRRRLSTIHVKPYGNCWYRRPSLVGFFEFARNMGFFEHFDRVMTYGSSMGGFAALSYAGLVGARRCLAIHPQLNLGPAVRSWETRFGNAASLDWSGPLCDIDRQIANVETVAIVCDHRHALDRRQADLVRTSVMRLNLPFVGHYIPHYLVRMGLAGKLFDDCYSGALDKAEIQRLFRRRRYLPAYRQKMRELTLAHPRRRLIVEAALAGLSTGVA